MAATPSIRDAVRSVRSNLSARPSNDREARELGFSVYALFAVSREIAADRETLGEVLALAPEVEAYRGKGARWAIQNFALLTHALAYGLKARLPVSDATPELFPKEDEVPPDAEDLAKCLQMLADHAFERVRGPRVRSRHAAELRAKAWSTLGLLAEILRRPEHLDHALKVAADPKASDLEREAAVEFLSDYWRGDDPDEATATLLRELEGDPPNRDFLVTVMQAQIDLGLNDEFGALFATDEWDDAREEE